MALRVDVYFFVFVSYLPIEYFIDKALVSCYTIPKGRFLATKKLYESINEKTKKEKKYEYIYLQRKELSS